MRSALDTKIPSRAQKKKKSFVVSTLDAEIHDAEVDAPILAIEARA